jgi:hypothetical protein
MGNWSDSLSGDVEDRIGDGGGHSGDTYFADTARRAGWIE